MSILAAVSAYPMPCAIVLGGLTVVVKVSMTPLMCQTSSKVSYRS